METMGHNKCVLTGYTGPFSGFVFMTISALRVSCLAGRH